MSRYLAPVAKGLMDALSPLEMALSSPDDFFCFLEDFGYYFDSDDVLDAIFDENGDYAQFAQIINSLSASISSARAMGEQIFANPSDVDAQEIIQLINDFHGLIDQLSALKGPSRPVVPEILDVDEIWDVLTEELPEYLLADYLAAYQPIIYSVLSMLGIARRILVQPDEQLLRRAYMRHDIRWDYLQDALSNPLVHLQEVYRWNGASKADDDLSGFDAEGVLEIFAYVANMARIRANVSPVSSYIWNSYYSHVPNPGARKFRPRQLNLPLYSVVLPGVGASHFDLNIAPIPEADSRDIAGLLLTHESYGSLNVNLPLAPGWAIGLTGATDMSYLLNLRILPSGLEIDTTAPSPPSMGLSFSGEPVARPDPATGQVTERPWCLFGDLNGTHISLGGISAGLGIAPSAQTVDLTLSAAFTDMHIAITGSDGDGLLSNLLSGANLESDVSLAASYSTLSGFELEGSARLGLLINIDRTIGPIYLGSIEMAAGLDADTVFIEGLFTGSATLGPIFLAVERVGLRADFEPTDDPNGRGMVGPFDLSIGFVPPSGYAASLDLAPIEGGGYVSIAENEYRGALALKFEKFGFSAFAILNTELPGGQPGFSLAASVFGEFNLPLAYGFFLTGLGGVLGINRTVDTDALRDVLYEGRMDDLLFPADPIGSAQQILTDMAAILPAREGQHFIGPVARISWGKPTLINITLGVIIEVGQDIRLVILGGLSMILPDEDKIIVALNLNFFGEIDFSPGTISFDASLEGSRVLTFTITGDIAIRTGWGPNIEHVASFGGLHPEYPRPSNLPDLKRLSIAFGGNNPKITLSAYQALTPNSLQFGARLDMYARGPKVKFVGQVAAEGFLAFDALIYFNPFEFFIDLAGGLSILVDGDVKAGLFFSLSLRGPNTFHIDGQVWVKVLGVKVKFGITHTFGQRQTIATATASAVDTLRLAVENSIGFEAVNAIGQDSAVAFRNGPGTQERVDPIGSLLFKQSAVPLGVALKKLGEADITGPKTVDLAVFQDNVELDTLDAESEFIRGQYFSLTRAERLRTPAFETHKSGFTFDSSGVALPAADSEIADEYAYEIFEIEMMDEAPATSVLERVSHMSANLLQRSTRVYQGKTFRTEANRVAQTTILDSVSTQASTFVSASQAATFSQKASEEDTSVFEFVVESDAVFANMSNITQNDNAVEVQTNAFVANYLAAA